MNEEKAFEYLIGAIIKAGVDFSYKGGTIIVSGLKIKCCDGILVVSTQHATNYFNLATLCYVRIFYGYLWISDNQQNVFSTYKLKLRRLQNGK